MILAVAVTLTSAQADDDDGVARCDIRSFEQTAARLNVTASTATLTDEPVVNG